jgi:ribonuclease P protein component
VVLSVHVCANEHSFARLGLIVPKRHVPRAVDRNRVKRLIREWFRHKQGMVTGSDLLVRVVSPIKQIQTIKSELDSLVEARL